MISYNDNLSHAFWYIYNLRSALSIARHKNGPTNGFIGKYGEGSSMRIFLDICSFLGNYAAAT